jgi:benzoylformate decarboxylase
MARCLGCPAVNVTTHDELLQSFDEVLPDLARRREPLLIEVALA